MLLLLITAIALANDHGFNPNINWLTFDDAKIAAAESDTPIFLLIHKSWCGACKRLKGSFADNAEIEHLSKSFTMVNTEDDDEPEGFAIDGGYIPRIFFLSPSGQLREDIYNEGGNAQYKYYYPDGASVAAGMKRALERLKEAKEVDEER